MAFLVVWIFTRSEHLLYQLVYLLSFLDGQRKAVHIGVRIALHPGKNPPTKSLHLHVRY